MKPNETTGASNKITRQILFALVAGVGVGALAHNVFPADFAKEFAGYCSLITTVFLRLIKMIIAPLVFATVVSGIANMGDTKAVGRVGIRALAWFLGASLTSLVIGLVMATVLEPGRGLSIALPAAEAATGLKTHALNVKDFLTQVFPASIFEAMSGNNILQILVFAVFFGFALASFPDKTAATAIRLTGEMVHVMLRVTNYVMRFAPFGVFGAVTSAITLQGLDVLLVYGRYMGGFYLALGILWCILIGAGSLVLKKSVFRLVRCIKDPMILGFSTASSEAAYPSTMMQLEKFGIKERIIGFVLPLGYSFNLDGSMINMTFLSLFIAQIYGVDLSLSQKIIMLLVLMVSSKGIAGVPRASLVVVAAVLPIFHLPEAGLLLIMGIDQFLDMGRTATNILGNSIATAVVAKWEGDIAPTGEAGQETGASGEFAEAQPPLEVLEPTA
ncbi:MAG: dicarboxylate/amino acid:cation symporter [Telmatospirillum sp.]|nr:dicarboxylate/amino acid:cation symporter [Telmatospirillum sp.]